MKTVLKIIIAICAFVGLSILLRTYLPEIASNGFFLPKTKLFLTFGTILCGGAAGLVLRAKS